MAAWRAVIASDALRKLLLMFRPYEQNAGDSDAILNRHLKPICDTLADPHISLNRQIIILAGIFEAARDDYLCMPLAEEPGSRPVVGVVGEIFLRFNEYSNQNIIRRIEAAGGEAPGAVASFQVEFGIDYPLVLNQSGDLTRGGLYRPIGLPTSWFIDQEGVVRFVFSGAMTQEMLLRIIDDLKAGREPDPFAT